MPGLHTGLGARPDTPAFLYMPRPKWLWASFGTTTIVASLFVMINLSVILFVYLVFGVKTGVWLPLAQSAAVFVAHHHVFPMGWLLSRAECVLWALGSLCVAGLAQWQSAAEVDAAVTPGMRWLVVASCKIAVSAHIALAGQYVLMTSPAYFARRLGLPPTGTCCGSRARRSRQTREPNPRVTDCRARDY
jgi:hypothetical protein